MCRNFRRSIKTSAFRGPALNRAKTVLIIRRRILLIRGVVLIRGSAFKNKKNVALHLVLHLLDLGAGVILIRGGVLLIRGGGTVNAGVDPKIGVQN